MMTKKKTINQKSVGDLFSEHGNSLKTCKNNVIRNLREIKQNFHDERIMDKKNILEFLMLLTISAEQKAEHLFLQCKRF